MIGKYKVSPKDQRTIDGITFASKKEMNCYLHLKILQRIGLISKLERQVRYPLTVNGFLICTYVSDFTFIEAKSLI